MNPEEFEIKLSELAKLEYTDLLSLSRKFAKAESAYVAARPGLISQNIAVHGTTTTTYFVQVLKLYLYAQGIHPTIHEGEYDNLLPEILNKSSGLYTFKPDIILILTDYRDIQTYPQLFSDKNDIEKWLEHHVKFYQSLWAQLEAIPNAQVFQTTFVVPSKRQLGQLEANLPYSRQAVLTQLNLELARQRSRNVHLIDLDYIAAYIGKRHWFDDKNYFMCKQGFSFEACGPVAQAVTGLVLAHVGKIKKCLVLDLDNTLWGGVIGDDGLEGINLDPNNAVGEAYIAFQTYIKALKERGVLLAVCSKNDEKNAKEPFEKHPNSILKLDDFSCFIANWRDKATNIKSIAKHLNIGLDSLVFFDDNPVERYIVATQFSEVDVIEVPEDPIAFCQVLEDANCFDWLQLSKEDLGRTQSFSQASQRAEMEADCVDYDTFLRSLEMKAAVKEVDEGMLSRFTQLINKTNQFNLRTQRYSESAVNSFLKDKNKMLYGVIFEDKFSHYGLISCVILEKQEQTLFVDTWLMSCRVLNRGLEAVVFNAIKDYALAHDIKKIVGEFIPTAKNQLVESLLSDFGFIKEGACHVLATSDAKEQSHFISQY